MNNKKESLTKNFTKWLLVILPIVISSLLWIIPIIELEKRAPKLDIKERIELEDKLRATLAQVFGGIFLLSGVYFSWRTLTQNKEGQITDRFYKAVEQLGGSTNQAVQIGGIYALERIARDSPKDHWTIMEVLCAFVRMYSPASGVYEKVEGLARTESMHKGVPVNSIEPDPVIQTILIVLGRRNIQYEKNKEKLDLRNTYLRGANLRGLNYANALFDNSHLEWAIMNASNLKGASFNDAHLEASFLCGANLENGDLLDSYLEGADLSNANLRNANLIYSHLQKATNDNCDIKGAKLAGSNLTGVDIRGFINFTEEQIGEAVVRLEEMSNELTYIKDTDMSILRD